MVLSRVQYCTNLYKRILSSAKTQHIKTIHKELRIDLIDDRANKLFSKFITTRQSHEIIA
ncbi:hypothetical protein BpHYR1_008605 [Brachionus plicatilis]|uniref:Uncharacterized protein n=1 Tax=Brachionus plicatilis TaxID=10195 RepID=A0A3M7T3D6_BRAPC|nr:hypothetical protein BpHYR1_008605 [Brachionus plicatilis]